MKPISDNNELGRTIRDFVIAAGVDPGSFKHMHKYLARLKEADEQFYEEYHEILQAIIEADALGLFFTLDKRGVFRKAIEAKDEAYLKFLRGNLGNILEIGNLVDPALMLDVLPAEEIDRLDMFNGVGGFWNYLIEKEDLNEYLETFLAAGRHRDSKIFDAPGLVQLSISLGNVIALETFILHGVSISKSTSGPEVVDELDSLEFSVNMGSVKCADYLLTQWPEDAIRNGRVFPITIHENADAPKMEILRLLDRHANRLGVDLDTYRDASGKRLHDYMEDFADDQKMDYLDFLRLRQAEKAAESAVTTITASQKPRL